MTNRINNVIWVLFGDDNVCKGVFLSEENLKNGVNYWMKKYPNECLFFEGWEVNNPKEPDSWDWAYIPVDSNVHELASGGGSVPLRKYWGQNLIGIAWESIDAWEAGYIQ